MTDKTQALIDAFEREFSSGDRLSDSIAFARNADGEYRQGLTRVCFKWFANGAALEQPAVSEDDDGWKPINSAPRHMPLWLTVDGSQVHTGYVESSGDFTQCFYHNGSEICSIEWWMKPILPLPPAKGEKI